MGEFHIYNMSEASRSIVKEATRVTFEAGYGTNLKIIHQGRIVTILDSRQQPDYVLTIYTQDYLGRQRPFSLHIDKGLTPLQAITAVTQKILGVIVNDGNLKGLSTQPIGKNILIDNLDYLTALSRLGKELDVNIWITNNVLYTSSKSPTEELPAGRETTILNYKTGMVGSPVIDVANAGILVESLLNGNLLPGNYVKVETIAPEVSIGPAKYVNFKQEDATRGEWHIFFVDHVGDSRGDKWISMVNAYGAKNIKLGPAA
jgi:hypothetical protein